ncbi:hypothetical protein AMECASPLE_035550 [Ameca splendens]|uniref:Secreted protein n=1 Tax=Ameca splendens TaxID=208324 RepID=A0ABV1AF98_9TELE
MSLHSSLVLAILERLEFVCLSVWTGVFYTDNEFKQVQLIQVICGEQEGLLKNKQTCERRDSNWLLGDQILMSFSKMQINYLKIIQVGKPAESARCQILILPT